MTIIDLNIFVHKSIMAQKYLYIFMSQSLSQKGIFLTIYYIHYLSGLDVISLTIEIILVVFLCCNHLRNNSCFICKFF